MHYVILLWYHLSHDLPFLCCICDISCHGFQLNGYSHDFYGFFFLLLLLWFFLHMIYNFHGINILRIFLAFYFNRTSQRFSWSVTSGKIPLVSWWCRRWCMWINNMDSSSLLELPGLRLKLSHVTVRPSKSVPNTGSFIVCFLNHLAQTSIPWHVRWAKILNAILNLPALHKCPLKKH